MSAIPRPSRAAMPGEIVNYYESGDPSEQPIPAIVHTEYGGNCLLTYQKPGIPTVTTKHGIKHIHDPFWDTTTIQNKQSMGAFDLHPVHRMKFDDWMLAANARAAKRRQEESERNELSTDEFNAINALERHGDNISAICTDTGLTPAQLKKLPKFGAELSKVKAANFEAKQAAKAGS